MSAIPEEQMQKVEDQGGEEEVGRGLLGHPI